jgi:hypothetical protein
MKLIDESSAENAQVETNLLGVITRTENREHIGSYQTPTSHYAKSETPPAQLSKSCSAKAQPEP